MKLCDLTISEKNELKEKLWEESFYHDGYTDYDYLSVENQAIVDACKTWEDIPDSVMEAAYDIYDFVEEDFFCNTQDQLCDRLGNEKEAV